MPLLGHGVLRAFDQLVARRVSAVGGEIAHHGQLDLDDRLGPVSMGRLAAAQHGGGIDHGADDGGVRGAAADVSGQRGFHLVSGGIEVLVEQGLRGDHPAGGAEAAIGGHVGVADALQGMQVLLVADSFDGENLFAGGFGREGVARVDRDAIDQHAARSATGAVATAVGAGEPELHGNHFPQRGARFVFGGERLAVDQEGGFLLDHRRGERVRRSRRGQDCVAAHRGEYDARSSGLQEISARVTHFEPPSRGNTLGRYCLWQAVQDASSGSASAASALASFACAAL